MNPNRFSSLNHFTLPVAIHASAYSFLECRGTAGPCLQPPLHQPVSARVGPFTPETPTPPGGGVLTKPPEGLPGRVGAGEGGDDKEQQQCPADGDQPGAQIEEV